MPCFKCETHVLTTPGVRLDALVVIKSTFPGNILSCSRGRTTLEKIRLTSHVRKSTVSDEDEILNEYRYLVFVAMKVVLFTAT